MKLSGQSNPALDGGFLFFGKGASTELFDLRFVTAIDGSDDFAEARSGGRVRNLLRQRWQGLTRETGEGAAK
jgi:hypothetical protein